MEQSMYHKSLRVGVVVVAFVLVFESGLLSETSARLAENTESYLASAIGVGASVPPNELNQLTAELTAQKRALEVREAALTERELAVGLLQRNGGSQDYSTYILASVLFILLVLILLNYTLDYVRTREEKLVDRQQVPV